MSSRGFALLITIVLLAFLVLLMVSLAAFTRVETQVAGNAQKLSVARQNALMGLNIALGELQRVAGPDQRLTARADILADADPSKRNWTGVWDSNLPNPPASSPPPVLAWLVSTADPATPATHIGSSPVQATIDAGTAVRLVGAGSVDTSVPGNEVIVPLRTITASSVPGLSGSQTVGKFGYWVGDEGVKARVNLESPGFKTTATATEAAYAFASAPRAAIELMERGAAPSTGMITEKWGTDLYPYADATTPAADGVSKILSIEHLALYAASGNATSARATTKARFHDLTACSASVLSDVNQGGLRYDLTRVLTDPSQGPPDDALLFPASGSASATYDHQRPPTWGTLRSWWNNPVNPNTGSLSPRLPTTTTPSISPVVMWCELGVVLFYEDLSPGGTGAGPFRLRWQGLPRVAIWNPYAVPFASGSYEMGISSPSGFNVQVKQAAGSNITKFSFSNLSYTDNQTRFYLRYRLDMIRPLAPGEMRVFSLRAADSGAIYSPGVTALEEGDFPLRYTFFNAVNDTFQTSLQPPYTFSFIDSSATTGMFFYLRPTGFADPGLPDANNPPPSSYVFAKAEHISPTLSGDLAVSAGPSAVGTAGQIRPFVSRASLNTVPSRWLANNNILSSYHVRSSQDGTEAQQYRGFVHSSSPANTASILPAGPMVTTNIVAGSAALSPLIAMEPRLSDAGLYQSIAQLQHAPLSVSTSGPLNAVGNSLQNPRISRDAVVFVTTVNPPPLSSPIYDSSYLLNETLWDKYFFSTVPNGLGAADLASASYRLPNARLRPLASADPDKLKRYDTAAAHLLLAGGFNIHSTSEQAWRAVLATAQGLKFNPKADQRNQSKTLQNPFSRFNNPLGDSSDRFRGYRELSDDQIAALAAAIVVEIKARGPFRSLADFVNRRLVSASDPNTISAATGLKGALQAAIDSVTTINNVAPYTSDIGASNSTRLDKAAVLGTADATPRLPVSSRNAFGPGFLSQADLLARIGSVLSARSDTFMIRSYGESINPATGRVDGRAWVEAVVQRVPSYVDSSVAPETPRPALTPGSDAYTFGRRFTVVSFRWLSPDEI